MKILFAISLLTCFIGTPSAIAEDYFPECAEVKSRADYKKLNDYFQKVDAQEILCQRLDSNEFLYFGGGYQWEKPHYCSESETGEFSCDSLGITRYPNLKKLENYYSKTGEQFLLLEGGRTSRGVHSSGISIFHLAPKTSQPAGYAFYELRGMGNYNGGYSDAGGFCSNIPTGREAIGQGSPYYEFIENDEQIILRFNLKTQVCNLGGVQSNRTVEYLWIGNRFRQRSDIREYF